MSSLTLNGGGAWQQQPQPPQKISRINKISICQPTNNARNLSNDFKKINQVSMTTTGAAEINARNLLKNKGKFTIRPLTKVSTNQITAGANQLRWEISRSLSAITFLLYLLHAIRPHFFSRWMLNPSWLIVKWESILNLINCSIEIEFFRSTQNQIPMSSKLVSLSFNLTAFPFISLDRFTYNPRFRFQIFLLPPHPHPRVCSD